MTIYCTKYIKFNYLLNILLIIACKPKNETPPTTQGTTQNPQKTTVLNNPSQATDTSQTANTSKAANTSTNEQAEIAKSSTVLSCPEFIPGSGDLEGFSFKADPFGCYGACGPACKTECVREQHILYVGSSGNRLSCHYEVATCKSHAFCRWHDDCYRQCDIRWKDSGNSEPPAKPPYNSCYLNCDNPVGKAEPYCAADWSQTGKTAPRVSNDCWDNSFVVFSKLLKTSPINVEQMRSINNNQKPWVSVKGTWQSSSKLKQFDTLPKGYSCAKDIDCPDRNDVCNSNAGDYRGINGWGRCAESSTDSKINISQMSPPGLHLGEETPKTDGTACIFGYECKNGWCIDGLCVDASSTSATPIVLT